MPSFFSGAPKETPSSDFSTTNAEMPLDRFVRVGDGEDGVVLRDPGVGDPALHAVEHPVVAVADRPGLHRGGVRAGLGLGEAVGEHPGAGRDRRAGTSSSAPPSPARMIGIVPSLFTPGISDDEAHARATSSMTMQVASASAPAPPYSSPMCGAAKSAAAARRTPPGGTRRTRRPRPRAGRPWRRTPRGRPRGSPGAPRTGRTSGTSLMPASYCSVGLPGSARIGPVAGRYCLPHDQRDDRHPGWTGAPSASCSRTAETWAVVGLSGNPHRTAYRIAEFLQGQGKRIVPIHPTAPTVLGEQGYATLADVPFADRRRRRVPPLRGGRRVRRPGRLGGRQGRLVPARRRRRRRLRADPRGRRADGDGHLPRDRVAAPERAR